jgi:hypothetical protein
MLRFTIFINEQKWNIVRRAHRDNVCVNVHTPLKFASLLRNNYAFALKINISVNQKQWNIGRHAHQDKVCINVHMSLQFVIRLMNFL